MLEEVFLRKDSFFPYQHSTRHPYPRMCWMRMDSNIEDLTQDPQVAGGWKEPTVRKPAHLVNYWSTNQQDSTPWNVISNRLYIASSRNRNWFFSVGRSGNRTSAFPIYVSKVVLPLVACSLLSAFPSKLVIARWVMLVSEVGASQMACAAFPDSSVQAGVAFIRI